MRVRVSPRVVPHVLSRRHRNLRVEGTNEQGDVTVTVTCGQDKHGLPVDVLPWLMQWGPAIEVLAPKRVRQHVARQLRAAAAAYGDPDDDTERVT